MKKDGGGKGKGNGEKGGENVIDGPCNGGDGGSGGAVVAEGNRRRGHHYPTIIRPRPNHCNPYFILRRGFLSPVEERLWLPRRLQARSAAHYDSFRDATRLDGVPTPASLRFFPPVSRSRDPCDKAGQGAQEGTRTSRFHFFANITAFLT